MYKVEDFALHLRCFQKDKNSNEENISGRWIWEYVHIATWGVAGG